MNILILGAAGFIGTNLTLELSKSKDNKLTLADRKKEWFRNIKEYNLFNIKIEESSLDIYMDFGILEGQDIIYHLVSTNVPTTSNKHISLDIKANVLFSAYLFDACVKYGVKKVVFISSGGTVYGKEVTCPISEDSPTNPITSYGLQKLSIEKLLYLYNYMYRLDYRIIRLANPYGPYQRPNGVLGAVTTFTYKALKREKVVVYGDGSVIRDFIYIDDAINAIIKITNGNDNHHVFNIGCGYGTSINKLLEIVEASLGIEMDIEYREGRTVDVPMNYLDISRYERYYGALNPISLEEGIKRTAIFMKEELL